MGEELGRGGFGIVFKATHRSLGTSVAVKVLLPHVLSDPSHAQRFHREVALTKRLSHPNTVRILDAEQTADGLPFFVMEYIEGRTLQGVLAREGKLSPARAARITIQVLKSLAEAHAQGIVHRDLKPGNIMIAEVYGERDYVKVLDFGIAKALETSGTAGATETGMILGTPAYMSPEQVRTVVPLDGRSDLYTLGLILFECLTGRPVVADGAPLEMLVAHASAESHRLPPQIASHPIGGVLELALAKNRDGRFASADAFRGALEGLDAASCGPCDAAPVARRPGRRAGRRRRADLRRSPRVRARAGRRAASGAPGDSRRLRAA